jgi:hypothetical protein
VAQFSQPARPSRTPWKILSRTAASGPEYAVNGAVYARVESPPWPGRGKTSASPLVELPTTRIDGSAETFGSAAKTTGKHALTLFPCHLIPSLKICGYDRWLHGLHRDRIAALDFQSANPTIVKSIKQRDLLNTWLRLYARDRQMPRMEEYQPSRLADELPDMVYLTVDQTQQPPRLTIETDGSRMVSAFGNPGKGRYLDEYLGTRLAPAVLPHYHECINRALPVYTTADIDDIYGRIVAYERLLLPFSDGGAVTHVIASLKTICEDGGFEIRNLMRGNDTLPTPKLCTVIDRDLFHRAPGRIPAGDVIEFS